MADRNSTPQEVVHVGPSWLATVPETDDSLDAVKQYRTVPVLRVVQGLSKQTLIDEFGIGGVVVMPGQVGVAEKEQPFLFAPVFLFTEFCQLSDIDDKEAPMSVARSFDENSELAIKARNADTRTEPYAGGKYKYRFVEFMNFIGNIYGDHPAAGTACTLSFSKGEYFVGTNFCSAIALRRVGGRNVPLWGQVWQFRSALRERGTRKWWGLDFSNPPVPYITDDEAPRRRADYEEFRELYKQKLIQVDREDDDAPDTVDDNEEL